MQTVKGNAAAIRATIRYHRDQKGDDRCWLDDFLIWKFLSDSPPEPTMFPLEQGMACCRSFYDHRRSDSPDALLLQSHIDPTTWDEDLAAMDEAGLEAEIQKLLSALRKHRDIAGRERTLDDDHALYEILPEKIPADFRLPSKAEFIDGVKPGCGCPNFWKSHENCPTKMHDLHRWGPCSV